MRVFVILLISVFSLLSCSKDCPEELPDPPLNSPIETHYGACKVVLDGDSRTDGWNCESEFPYKKLLAFGDSIEVDKISYGGATSWELNYRADNCYNDMLDIEKVNIIVLWIGVNDILVHNKMAENVFHNIEYYCKNRRSEGWNVILCTEISMAGKRNNVVYDKERQILNQMIYNKRNDLAVGIADLARSCKIGSTGSYNDSNYFCDGVHLTKLGTIEVASTIERAIKSFLKIPLVHIDNPVQQTIKTRNN